jgi:hypothetical protein
MVWEHFILVIDLHDHVYFTFLEELMKMNPLATDKIHIFIFSLFIFLIIYHCLKGQVNYFEWISIIDTELKDDHLSQMRALNKIGNFGIVLLKSVFSNV